MGKINRSIETLKAAREHLIWERQNESDSVVKLEAKKVEVAELNKRLELLTESVNEMGNYKEFCQNHLPLEKLTNRGPISKDKHIYSLHKSDSDWYLEVHIDQDPKDQTGLDSECISRSDLSQESTRKQHISRVNNSFYLYLMLNKMQYATTRNRMLKLTKKLNDLQQRYIELKLQYDDLKLKVPDSESEDEGKENNDEAKYLTDSEDNRDNAEKTETKNEEEALEDRL